MQTVSYKRVLRKALSRCGVDIATASDKQLRQFIEWGAGRVEEGWETFQWPDTIEVEKRYFQEGLWDNATEYTAGQIVFGGTAEKYYQAKITNTGNEPSDSDTTNWQEPTEAWHRKIPLAQTNENEIGMPLSAHHADPRIEPYCTQYSIHFYDGQDAYLAAGEGVNYVWLRYRRPLPDFSAAIWSASATYASGDIIYYDPTGEVYRVTATTTAGQDPQDTPASFTLVAFPKFLERFVSHAIYADYLVEQAQTEKARIEENRAQAHLNKEINDLVKNGAQRPRLHVSVRRPAVGTGYLNRTVSTT